MALRVSVLNLGLANCSKCLWEGGRGKHAPSEVDPSAELRLAARCLSSRSCHPHRRSRPERQPRVQNVPPDRMRYGCLEPAIERRH
jgi:hypothetical protein